MSTLVKTTWAIDPTHSEVEFKIKHLVISTLKGIFKDSNSLNCFLLAHAVTVFVFGLKFRMDNFLVKRWKKRNFIWVQFVLGVK